MDKQELWRLIMEYVEAAKENARAWHYDPTDSFDLNKTQSDEICALRVLKEFIDKV